MHEALNAFLAVFGAIVFAGYLCRFDALNWRDFKPSVITFHLALAITAAWGSVQGWQGTSTPGDWAGVSAAALWLTTSYHTWRAGPPEHARKTA